MAKRRKFKAQVALEALIRRAHLKLSIRQQCRLVKLSRSAFYYAPVGIDAAIRLQALITLVDSQPKSERSAGFRENSLQIPC